MVVSRPGGREQSGDSWRHPQVEMHRVMEKSLKFNQFDLIGVVIH